VLLERIGRGGMAEVFRAVAQGVEGFQRVFVVKRIQREQSDNPQLVEMFANEARISALLNHPNIVQVFDFGQLDGSYFISMEYLRGKDLLAVLRQLRAANRFMSPALVAMIAREVATGLAYAHTLVAPGGKSLDIIHRDVSPSNIMLLRAGGVKLLDFGIAKASAALRDSGHGHTTGTGLVKGKLSYLSPEQVRHEPVDARSDIFSLGVVMWECLTGKRLFHDRSDYHTMNNVLTRVVPPPSSLQPGVPAALDEIVLHALDRHRATRTQSAKMLADALDHFLVEHPLAPRSQPRLLDELFGDDGHELEAMPAVGAGMLPSDSETPVLTAVMLPTIPSITAIMAVPNGSGKSDSLPPTSFSGDRTGSNAVNVRLWPWVAGAVLVVAAFATGRLLRPQDRADDAPVVAAAPAPAVVVVRQPAAAPPRPDPAPMPPAAEVPGGNAPPPAAPAPIPPAAHAAPEPSAEVSLRVESDPAGAEVIGPEGALLGRTPLTTNVPRSASPLILTVSKTGFAPSRHTVTPDRDVAALVNLRATPTKGGRSERTERSERRTDSKPAPAPTHATAATSPAEPAATEAAPAPAAAAPVDPVNPVNKDGKPGTAELPSTTDPETAVAPRPAAAGRAASPAKSGTAPSSDPPAGSAPATTPEPPTHTP
jgi:serine/threonine protein kinase